MYVYVSVYVYLMAIRPMPPTNWSPRLVLLSPQTLNHRTQTGTLTRRRRRRREEGGGRRGRRGWEDEEEAGLGGGGGGGGAG